jgi:hypothetical protein
MIVALVPPETLLVHVDADTVEESAASRFRIKPFEIGEPRTNRPLDRVEVVLDPTAVVDSIERTGDAVLGSY